MLQPGSNPFNDPLRLHLIPRGVLGKSVQDVNLAPLGAFIQRRQEFLQHGASDQCHILPRGLLNLGEGRHCIRDNCGIGIANEVSENVQKPTVFDHLGGDIIELGDADSSRLAHVGVVITQGTSKGLAEIFNDAVHADAAHRPNSKGADEGIGVVGILAEGVDGEEGQVGVALGVVDDVEVDEFFKLYICGLDAIHHVGEKHGNIFPDGHVGDDLFDSVTFLVLVLGLKFLAEFVGFAFFGRVLEEARVGATAHLPDSGASITRDLVDGTANAHCCGCRERRAQQGPPVLCLMHWMVGCRKLVGCECMPDAGQHACGRLSIKNLYAVGTRNRAWCGLILW